jgi:hypothetical protein
VIERQSPIDLVVALIRIINSEAPRLAAGQILDPEVELYMDSRTYCGIVLADIDADDGNCAVEILRHGMLLVVGAPGQLQSLPGQEHGRTIPLADIGVSASQKSHRTVTYAQSCERGVPKSRGRTAAT